MAVRIKQKQGATGGNPFNLWEDNFPNTASFRNSYASYGNGVNDATPVVAANRLAVSGIATASVGAICLIPLLLGGARSLPQFSEFIYRTNQGIIGAETRFGLCLCASSDFRTSSPARSLNQFYNFLIRNELNNAVIARQVNSVNTVLATIAEPAINDKCTFTANWTVAGTVNLEVLYNDISVGTFIDNAVAIQTGLPGIFISQFDNAVAMEISDFRAGVLSRL